MRCGELSSIGSPPVQRIVALSCILTLLTTGCATQRTAFLPADANPQELAATIAARGMDSTPSVDGDTHASSRPLTTVDSCAQGVVRALPIIGTGVVAAPLIVLWAVAKGPHSTVDLSKADWFD
jgi:hypothetical protein